ncbi:MAG: type 1 fimbrial protein [Proteus hauseri]|nr:type 1 fimbrial protein [Proteus hauseri]
MKRTLFPLTLLVSLICLPTEIAWAVADPLIVSPPPMNFDGAADGTPAGTPITSTWIGETSVYNGFKCENKPLKKCWVETLYANALGSKISGVYYYEGGNRYPVYALAGVKGIGYAFGLKDNNDNVSYVPIDVGAGSSATIIYPAVGSTVSKNVDRVSLKGKVVFVVTDEHLETGVYNIPYTVIANTWSEYGGSHKGNNTSLVAINPVTITIKARGCTVNTKNLTYELGDISMRDMATIGSTSKIQTKPISVTCDTNVHLYASMTDQSTYSNHTDVLTLTSDSDASGIGIQFLFNDNPTPVVYGPDISATGQPNQRLLHITTSNNENYTLNLSTRYITTGTLKPGKANGLASLTFSYQ